MHREHLSNFLVTHRYHALNTEMPMPLMAEEFIAQSMRRLCGHLGSILQLGHGPLQYKQEIITKEYKMPHCELGLSITFDSDSGITRVNINRKGYPLTAINRLFLPIPTIQKCDLTFHMFRHPQGVEYQLARCQLDNQPEMRLSAPPLMKQTPEIYQVENLCREVCQAMVEHEAHLQPTKPIVPISIPQAASL